jgi:hypothetical protein
MHISAYFWRLNSDIALLLKGGSACISQSSAGQTTVPVMGLRWGRVRCIVNDFFQSWSTFPASPILQNRTARRLSTVGFLWRGCCGARVGHSRRRGVALRRMGKWLVLGRRAAPIIAAHGERLAGMNSPARRFWRLHRVSLGSPPKPTTRSAICVTYRP